MARRSKKPGENWNYRPRKNKLSVSITIAGKNHFVIAKALACGDPLAARLKWLKHTTDCRVETKVSPRSDGFKACHVMVAVTMEALACGDPLAARLKWPKYRWIAASE